MEYINFLQHFSFMYNINLSWLLLCDWNYWIVITVIKSSSHQGAVLISLFALRCVKVFLSRRRQFEVITFLSNMGARVGRMIRNFNLENRAFREISKQKPTAAPRHAAVEATPPATSDGECPDTPVGECGVGGHWLTSEPPRIPTGQKCASRLCSSGWICEEEGWAAAGSPQVRVRGVQGPCRRWDRGQNPMMVVVVA